MMKTWMLVLFGLLGPVQAQGPSGSGHLWRSPMMCGANCVYLLSAIAGLDTDYDEVVARVGVTEKGSTLRDMESACRSLGLDWRAARGRPGLLLECEYPIVVHLDHHSGSVDEVGHFVLLTSYDEERDLVEYLDPITVLSYRVSVDAFRRSWSGYALVPSRSGWALWGGPMLIMLLVFFGGRYLLSRSKPEAAR